MQIDYKILSAGLALLLAAKSLESRQNRQAAEKLGEVAQFYAAKLDQNGIQMTEFDEIAIKTIVS